MSFSHPARALCQHQQQSPFGKDSSVAWPGLTTAFAHIQRVLKRRGCADEGCCQATCMGTGTALPGGAVGDRPCWGCGAEPCPSRGGRLHQHHSTPHLPAPCPPAVPVPLPVHPSRGQLPRFHPRHHPALPSRVPSPLSSRSGISTWRFDHVYFLSPCTSQLLSLSGSPFQPFGYRASLWWNKLFYLQINVKVLNKLFWPS